MKQKKKEKKKNLMIASSLIQPRIFLEYVNPGTSSYFNVNHSMTNV